MLQSSELYYLNRQATYKSILLGITSAINLIKTVHEVNHITGSFVGTSQHSRNIHFFKGEARFPTFFTTMLHMLLVLTLPKHNEENM